MSDVSDTIRSILTDIENGIPKDVAVAYWTARGGAPRPTQARTVQQTVTVPSPSPNATNTRPGQPGRRATLEEMSSAQLLRELRKLCGRYNYQSLASNIICPVTNRASGLVRMLPVTAVTVRGWNLGDLGLNTHWSIDAVRRFLIKHRDDRASLDLRPAGLRAGPRG